MEKKITKREVIVAMLADATIADNATYVAYLENELAILDRKAANRKPTKTQEENVDLMNRITAVMSTDNSMTVTEIMKSDEVLAGMSNQKISALVRKLVADGKAIKVTEKNVSKFTLVDED